jgi:hypothetical protein
MVERPPEVALEVTIAEQSHATAGRIGSCGFESAAQSWLNSEDSKEVCRDACSGYLFRPFAASTVETCIFHTSDRLKAPGLLGPLPKVLVRSLDPLANVRPQSRILFPDHDQTVRLLVGELVQQDGIDDAEDCCVGADAQHQMKIAIRANAGLLRNVRVA